MDESAGDGVAGVGVRTACVRPRRIWWVAAAAFATGLLLAGCSSGGTAATTPPAASATTPAATDSTGASGASGAADQPAAGGQATRAAAPSNDGAATGPQRCTTGELSASLGAGDAGAGSVFRTLVFTNTGKRTCELRGFPGVSYVAGDDGQQVGPAAAMSGARGGQVPIAPGHTAVAKLRLVQVLNFDEAVCRPTPVRGLRIYPPGDTASLFVSMDGTGCAGTPPTPQLEVQTITAK